MLKMGNEQVMGQRRNRFAAGSTLPWLALALAPLIMLEGARVYRGVFKRQHTFARSSLLL